MASQKLTASLVEHAAHAIVFLSRLDASIFQHSSPEKGLCSLTMSVTEQGLSVGEGDESAPNHSACAAWARAGFCSFDFFSP